MWNPGIRNEIQDLFSILTVPDMQVGKNGERPEVFISKRALSGRGTCTREERVLVKPRCKDAADRRARRLAAQKRYNDKRPKPTEELRARRRENKRAWLARRQVVTVPSIETEWMAPSRSA